MLNRLEVVTDQGVVLTLPLSDTSNGYSVRDIDGLDPVKATLVSSPFAQIDGEQYQAARREKRNIILTLGLEADYVVGTPKDLRNALYGFFMPKSRVLLRFYQDSDPMIQIYGIVENFDSPKFIKDPTAIISILCFDPDFYDPTIKTISGNTTSSTTETPYAYNGTVETGITFTLNVNRALSSFTIYHRPADDSLRTLSFQTASPLSAGDVVTISTIPGSKFVKVTRAGVDISYLFAVSPQSNWIQLFPGSNKLRIYAEGAGIPYTITYTTKIGAL